MEENNKTPDISGAATSSQGDAHSAGAATGPAAAAHEAPPGSAPGSASGQGAQAGQPQPGQELLDELTQLADKFASVVKTAWNSEQRKQIENDVRTGLTTMTASIEDGFKQVAASNEAKDLQTKAVEVSEKVSSSKFFADMTSALTTGLRTLSDQLDKVAADIQTKNAQPGAGTPPSGSTGATGSTGSAGANEAAKDIPISKE
jgi:uncharacterized phage infection (PIP) family protein YhgE